MRTYTIPLFVSIAIGIVCFLVMSHAEADSATAVKTKSISRQVDPFLLDQLVRLSPEQKLKVDEIFADATNAINALSSISDPTAISRTDHRTLLNIYRESRAQIRAILTPEQLAIYEATPQSQGGGSAIEPRIMRHKQAVLAALLNLSKEQVSQVSLIAENAATAVQGLGPEGNLHCGKILTDAHDQIRAVLTPEQQVLYDSHPFWLPL